MDDIQYLRGEIDRIDDEILALLISRFDCVTKVADLKQQNMLPVFDGKREQDLLQRLGKKAHESGLRADLVQAIFTEIIHQSSRLQEARIAQSDS